MRRILWEMYRVRQHIIYIYRVRGIQPHAPALSPPCLRLASAQLLDSTPSATAPRVRRRPWTSRESQPTAIADPIDLIRDPLSDFPKITAESFPEDIIIDILLRLPAKSLMRFKCVCKRWRSLISDPGFVKSHLQRLKAGDLIPSQRIIIGSVHSCLFGSNYCPLTTIDCEALDGSEGGAVLPHRIQPFLQPWIVGSSDGLVCFLDSDIFLKYNPTTREYGEFPRSDLAEEWRFIGQNELFHGFGYDSRSDDYKIVEGIADDEDWEVEIFSLKSSSWTSILLDFEEESHLVVSGKNGVYWNGALHWCVRRWISPKPRDEIMSFDLSEEKFHRKLSVPEVDGDRVFGGLGIHGANLFRFSSGPDTRIHAWITDEYGRAGSWTKWFIVDCIPASRNIPLAYTRSGKILLQKDKDRVILFNPEDNTYKDYSIGKSGVIYYAIYLETLISPLSWH